MSYVYWGGRTLNPNGFTVYIYIHTTLRTLSMVMFICWLLIWALNIISWISWKWKILLQRELQAKWIDWPGEKFWKFLHFIYEFRIHENKLVFYYISSVFDFELVEHPMLELLKQRFLTFIDIKMMILQRTWYDSL